MEPFSRFPSVSSLMKEHRIGGGCDAGYEARDFYLCSQTVSYKLLTQIITGRR